MSRNNDNNLKMFVLQKNHFWWKNISWMIFASLILLITSQIIKYELDKLQIGKSLYSWRLTKTFLIEIVVENNPTFLFGIVQQPNVRMRTAIMFGQIITICIIIGAICYWKNCFLTFVFLIILVGALGNFINRLWNEGKVIDYLKITTDRQSSTNFNLEDFLMGFGIILLVIQEMINLFWLLKKQVQNTKNENYSSR